MKPDKRIKNGKYILPRLPRKKDARIKIKYEDIYDIIKDRKNGISYEKIGLRYGVSWFAIYRICNPEKAIDLQRGRKRPRTKKDNNAMFIKKYKEKKYRKAYSIMRKKLREEKSLAIK